MTDKLRDRIAAAAGQTGAEVATRDQPKSIAGFIDQMKTEIARALPRHMNADRLARVALTCVRTTKDLDKCTQESFGGALMTCAQLGLEPGSASGEAYLVPFRSGYLSDRASRQAKRQIDVYEATLIIGYQGMIKLFWQSPLAKSLDAQAVYENDEFDYEYGLNPRLVHKPNLRDRGKNVIAYYAVATLTNGGGAFVVLSPRDIEAIKTRSKAGGRQDSPWKTDYDAMAKKTCIRQLFKLLPKSPELARALAQDEGVRTDTTLDGIDVSPPFIEGEVVQDAPVPFGGEPGSTCGWCGQGGHLEDSCPQRGAGDGYEAVAAGLDGSDG